MGQRAPCQDDQRLPANLTGIGRAAFSKCSSLSDVTLAPNPNLTVTGRHAFSHCKTLVEVTLPDGLRKIGRSAFAQNTESVI